MDEIIILVRMAKLELERAKNGEEAVNQPAFNELYEKYKPLIARMANSFYTTCNNPEFSQDDFWQYASWALSNAVEKFDETKKITFGAFAKKCIKNKLIDVFCRRPKEKREPKEHQSFDDTVSLDVLSKEDRRRITFVARESLSRLEFEMFELCCEGLKPRDIASRLGKDVKSVNNALYRMRKKLYKVLR